MSLIFNGLLNEPATPGNIATRPESGDADFRALSVSPGGSDDEARTISAATHAPGDHGLPIPFACTTPAKLLKWLLDSIIREQGLATNSPVIVTRSSLPTGTTGNTLRHTYNVSLSLNLEDEALDPAQVVEPTFVYPS